MSIIGKTIASVNKGEATDEQGDVFFPEGFEITFTDGTSARVWDICCCTDHNGVYLTESAGKSGG